MSKEIKYLHKVVRHFKGNYYYIESVARHSETDELLVIYRPLYESSTELYARPLSMFFEPISPDREDNITHQSTRFAIVEDIKKDYLCSQK